MATLRSGISPGVRVQEIDISDFVNNEINTVAMLIGNAQKGPAFKIDVIQSERDYVEAYGQPNDDTAQSFYAASGYFSRGSNLLFTRVVDKPRAVVAAVGFDANSDGEPDGALPTVENLDPLLYNNDPTEYVEASEGATIPDQDAIEDYYNTGEKSVQAFHSRLTLNRAFPRERQKVYQVGDLVHDGWFESTELGQVENFSEGDGTIPYPNGFVYRATTAGLTSNAWNQEDQKTDAISNGLGTAADLVLSWDTAIGGTTVDGEVIWERVDFIEETWFGGIKFLHGPTVDPEMYDPDDTSTFDFNVEINNEAKSEDLVVAAIGPGHVYNDFYVAIMGYKDAQNLRKFPFSLLVPRDTMKSDSFVPEEFANWNGTVKRVLSKVTYQEWVDEFDYLSLLPENLPESADEFGLFLLARDTVSNTWSVSEYHRCSTDADKIDGNGDKLFVEDVVNNSSNNIRVKLSDLAVNSEFTTTLPIALLGGYNGELENFYETTEREGNTVTLEAEVFAAADIYREADIDIDVVIEGDKPLASKLALAQLAEDLNGEAIAVLDVPSQYNTPETIAGWAQESLLLGGDTGSYAALYHNRLKVLDKYNGIFRWVAPSGTVAGVYAQVDEEFFPWYAPAGMRRGTLNEVVDLRDRFRLAARDVLYANRVNPIAVIRSAITVYGQKTLLDRTSYLQRVHVRRLLGYLKRKLRRAAEQFVFEFNDEITRENVRMVFNEFLNFVQNNRGLQEFLVVCDESNNPPIVLDNSEMYIDIYIKPPAVAEFINLRFFITRSGVNLAELAARNTGPNTNAI